MKLVLPRRGLEPRADALADGIDVELWSEHGPSLSADSFVCLTHPPAPWQLAALAQAPRGLLGVQVLSAGVDHLRGHVPPEVPVFRAPHLRGSATAEVAVALTLMSVLEAPTWSDVAASQQWRWLAPQGRVHGRNVLVLGRGEVGVGIERAMVALGAQVTMVGRAPEGLRPQALRQVPQADIVFLALPLTEQTERLFDRDMLERMRPGALLVNVARGGLVDSDALVELLHEGRISAALDVVDPEPLPDGHPLWACPHLILSPHVGGNILIDDETLSSFIADQANRLASGGEPLHRAAPEYYAW